MKKLISITVPVYNEEQVVGTFLDELIDALSTLKPKYKFEIILVDDGSLDKTSEVVRNYLFPKWIDCVLIRLTRNFGHQAALLCGYEQAIGEVIISLDSDLQDPPSLIPKLVEEYEMGFDVVLTKRSTRDDALVKRIEASLFYYLFRKLVKFKAGIQTADFRLMSRRSLDYLLSFKQRDLYIRGLVDWMGFPSTIVEFKRPERFAGTSKYSIKKRLRLAFDGLLGFSDSLLRIPIYTGFLSIFVTFLLVFYFIMGKISNPSASVPGYASTVVFTLVAFGIQSLSLGILGVYLHRVLNEVSARPNYLIWKNEKISK